MAAIGSKHKRLYVDLRVNGKRYKEYLSILDTPANWKKVAVVMKRMEAEITLETFSYRSTSQKAPTLAYLTGVVTTDRQSWFKRSCSGPLPKSGLR